MVSYIFDTEQVQAITTALYRAVQKKEYTGILYNSEIIVIAKNMNGEVIIKDKRFDNEKTKAE